MNSLFTFAQHLHRDLKPENIFIDKYLFPKIGDFGLSKEIKDITIKNDNQTNSGHVGTIPYLSPEILAKLEYTKKGDVYTFSFIVYEILTNESLFNGCQVFQIMQKVSNGFRPVIQSEVSINLDLAEDTIDENDPLIKNCFLKLNQFEIIKLCNKNDSFKIYEVKH